MMVVRGPQSSVRPEFAREAAVQGLLQDRYQTEPCRCNKPGGSLCLLGLCLSLLGSRPPPTVVQNRGQCQVRVYHFQRSDRAACGSSTISTVLPNPASVLQRLVCKRPSLPSHSAVSRLGSCCLHCHHFSPRSAHPFDIAYMLAGPWPRQRRQRRRRGALVPAYSPTRSYRKQCATEHRGH
ncbi:hypothetical protein FKP32DRAFT_943210 [Trametes sanguinea]|nr:hypothetical protein FKP32DRAFT_943210 [Trametes sanguinea]